MKIVVVTLFPQMVEDFLRWGILAQAIKRGLVEVECCNLREFADNRFGHIDDRPYGGGPGMVLKYQPLRDAIEAMRAKLPRARVCHLSPQGTEFNQAHAQRLCAHDGGVILLCGRYEGIDQRVIERWVDEEISIGPYVLSGGEIAALVVVEACVRLIPGAVGDAQSVQEDSHSAWAKYDHPHYTRPEEIDGMRVPEVLLSGDHKAIEKWRQSMRTQHGGQRAQKGAERGDAVDGDGK